MITLIFFLNIELLLVKPPNFVSSPLDTLGAYNGQSEPVCVPIFGWRLLTIGSGYVYGRTFRLGADYMNRFRNYSLAIIIL